MNPVLMVMHAREIPECLEAFHNLKGVDKVWFRGYTEIELERVTSEFIRGSDYSHYLLASDDLIPTQKGLDEVLKGLESHDVFTGFSNMYPTSERVNLMLEGYSLGYRFSFWLYHKAANIKIARMGVSATKAAWFARMAQIPKGEFQTWFVGFSFTGMTRDLWLRFPFLCVHDRSGWGSDAVMSLRLARDFIPAYSNNEAFFYHLASAKNFIVGSVPKQTILEKIDWGKVVLA